MYDFRAPMARLGVPSTNRITMSQNGTWHLPHGGAPIQHKPEGSIFSETVGAIQELEFADGQMWGVGQVEYSGVAEALNARVTCLSIEVMDMEFEMVNGSMYVDTGYIRSALLVSPQGYGWEL